MQCGRVSRVDRFRFGNLNPWSSSAKSLITRTRQPRRRSAVHIIGESDVKFSVAVLNDVNATSHSRFEKDWLRGLDLNQRPSGYEPDELPGCSTPRARGINNARAGGWRKWFVRKVVRAS